MAIISLNINGLDHYFNLPKATVDKMLVDPAYTEMYFREAVKLSYLTQYPEGAKVTNLLVWTRIPIDVPPEYITKLGYWKNQKILQSIRKKKEEDHPVDVIQMCVGVFGRWHLAIFLLILLCKFPVGFHQLSIIFLGPVISYECSDNATAKCSENCHSYTYDKSTFENTITMEWDLVCEKEHLVKFAQTLTMIGILVGNLLFGYLSDKLGRQKMLVCEVGIQAVTGLATAFVPWFWLFLVLRFLTAAATGGSMVSSFVLIMEVIGWKRRTILGILYHIPTSVGHALLAPISYYWRDWKAVQIAISAPSLLTVCCYWLLPESPRWLLLIGKRDRAVEVLKKGAKCNKLPIERIEGDVDKYLNDNRSLGAHQTGRIQELFQTPIMRTYTLAICFNWMAVGLSYFGLSQYISQFGGNIFINVGFSGLIQIPGILFACWCTKAWGRKWSLIISNLIVAATCLILTVVTSMVPYDCALAVVGLFGSILAFSTVYIYSGEIFPTTLRNFGVGLSSTSARIGSMVAPFVVGLDVYRLFLPPLIFGVFALASAGMCFLLPETLDCELPKTVEDVEHGERAIRRARAEQ